MSIQVQDSNSNMVGSNSRLINTLKIVEYSKRRRQAVPSHIINTKIYSSIGSNAIVEATPAVLHYAGFEPGQSSKQLLKLVNVSSDVQRIHIIPPQSAHFRLTYTKQERLVPGLGVSCVVEFFPDDWRYYYDCIRVHCKDDTNLLIPIHAYPIMNASEFPKHLTFQATPVGQSVSQSIPLRSIAPIDFDFQLSCIQQHPAFTVTPMSGIVPANGDVDITITFAPTEFSTARMVLQLVVSQFNSSPLTCTVLGNSIPGHARNQTILVGGEKTEDNCIVPRSVAVLDRVRHKKTTVSDLTLAEQQKSHGHRSSLFDEYGVVVPNNLDNPHAVAQVLTQESGKLKLKYLKDVVEKGRIADKPTRQMKEALFEAAARQNLEEEKQNQLRWQVKCGDKSMTTKSKAEVLAARQDTYKEYLLKQGLPPLEAACNWETSQRFLRQTYRRSESMPSVQASFDVYNNNLWTVKHDASNRFQIAARKVMMQLRAEKKLQKFRTTVLNRQHPDRRSVNENEDSGLSILTLDVCTIAVTLFPTFIQPAIKNETAVDSLGSVNCKSTEMAVVNKTHFCELKIPLQYVNLGYVKPNVHSAIKNYVPPDLARPLRSGAEDEVISVPVMSAMSPLLSVTDEMLMLTPALKPPPVLFEPARYLPLHIFNSCPSLQVFKLPLPFDETSPDFRLCPLPRYSDTTTSSHSKACAQKKFLDREDTIKGIMHWKRFPSQSLLSLNNTPTLSNVWVPRWSNPFGTDILPTHGPTLLKDLPQVFQTLVSEKQSMSEDRKTAVDEATYSIQSTLSQEMIAVDFLLSAAQSTPDDSSKEQDAFPMGNKLPLTNAPVSTNGSVSRWQRENELIVFLSHKFNQTGSRMKYRVLQLSKLCSQAHLLPQYINDD